MGKRIKKGFRYLLLTLPLIIYFGLTVILTFEGIVIYYMSYVNAYLYLLITKRIGYFDASRINIPDMVSDTFLEMLVFVLPILTGIFFCFWYGLLIKKEKTQEPRIKLFTIKNILLLALAGLSLQLVISGLMELILPYFKTISEEYEKIMEQLFAGNPILVFISVVIIAPISEEFTFRGVILKRAGYLTSFTAANIIQALLFAIAHLNIVQGIYAFIGGLAMGYVVYKYKSIKASILMHMFFNGLGYFLMAPVNTFMMILYVAVGTVLLIIALRQIKKAGNGLKPYIMASDTYTQL